MNTIVDRTLAKKISEASLSIGAVSFNTKKPFRYASGILSPMYTDNRLFISYPRQWQEVLTGYISILKQKKLLTTFDIVSGTATAGIPHAAALAYVLKRPMIYVRSSKKDHGKGNQIEGRLAKGKRVLIIEDLVSTASSTQTNCLAVRENGGIVRYCLAITTSTLDAYDQTIKSLKLQLFTLTNVQTTLDVAVSTKRITAQQKESVETFLANPAGWGKAMGFNE